MDVRGSEMMIRPESKPSWWLSFVVACQHVFLLTVGFLFIVYTLCEQAGLPPQAIARFAQICAISAAVGALLMSAKGVRFGTGALCVQVCAAAYLHVVIDAYKAGGLPLLSGLTVFAGIVQVLFARCIPRLRQWFPTEILGVAIFMQGVSFVHTAGAEIEKIGRGTLDLTTLFIALGVLAIVLGMSIFGRGVLRLTSVLLAIVYGVVACLVFLPGSRSAMSAFWDRSLPHLPWFAIPPIDWPNMTLGTGEYLLPFAVTALVTAVKAMGDLSVLQKISDPGWHSPDYARLGRGVLSNGIGMVVGGLLGGLPMTASATSVGVAFATGATARRMGYAAAAILFVLAFFPRILGLIEVVPPPIRIASWVFVACFNLATGLQIILSRVLDSRRTFVIGLPILFGMSIILARPLYIHVPVALRPIVEQPMVAAVLLALVVNFFLTLGIDKRLQKNFPLGSSDDDLVSFVQSAAASWAIRRESAHVLGSFCRDVTDLLRRFSGATGTVDVGIKYFDGFMTVDLAHDGPPVGPSAGRPNSDSDAFLLAWENLGRRFPDMKTGLREGRQSFALNLESS